MEGGVALGFLEHLVDVAVEQGERTESFQVGESARAVGCAPTPLRISHPQRHMCEHHNGRAVGHRLEIIFHPFKLLIAELAKATFANRHHVVQANEVRARVVEAEPALAFRALAKTFEVLFAVVVEHVVLAGDIKHLLRFAGLENLLERVEFFRL